MNLRFSGISEIQTALVKGLEASQSAQDIMLASFVTDCSRGQMEAWTEAAVRDQKFPEFIDQFGSHADALIDTLSSPDNPNRPGRTLKEVVMTACHGVSQKDLPQAFLEFASNLVTNVFALYEKKETRDLGGISGRSNFNWKKLQDVLNILKPDQMGELKIRFESGDNEPGVEII